MEDYTPYAAAWIGLLAAPLVALAAFTSTRGYWRFMLRWLVSASALTLAIVVTSNALGFSFRGATPNVAAFIIAYGAYCFLAFACWQIRFLPLRLLALAVGVLPIIAGYALGTVGMLGLLFIIGDYARPPVRTEQLEGDLQCEVRLWGMAASDSGYTVRLYRVWTKLPFIEQSLARASVNQTDTSKGPPQDVTCADLVTRYEKKAPISR